MQVLTHLPAHHHLDDRSDRRRRNLEKRRGASLEIRVVEPARFNNRPIEMVLAHLLDGPSDAALLIAEALVEIELVFLLDVPPDEGRIRHDRAVVVDVGELALGRLAEALGVLAIDKPGELQEHQRLRDEGARIDEPEGRTERIDSDHWTLPVSTENGSVVRRCPAKSSR